MSQFNLAKNQAAPDHLYFDITIANLQTTISTPPFLYFNEIRDKPFIDCPENYEMSIIRFSLDTPTLPVFIPEIAVNSGNVNQTIYSFQFSYNGVYSEQIFIQWSPQDLSANVPTSISSSGIQNSYTYYYCYNYTYFIDLINTQLSEAFKTFALSTVLPDGASSPKFYWDCTNNLASIVFDDTWLSTEASPIYLYFNDKMPLIHLLFLILSQVY
jgi:hypothetical protein